MATLPFYNTFIHTPLKSLFTKRRGTISEPDPAAVREHTSLYDEEDEVTHWSEHFDSYEDLMAAANDPNLGDGTD